MFHLKQHKKAQTNASEQCSNGSSQLVRKTPKPYKTKGSAVRLSFIKMVQEEDLNPHPTIEK